MTHSSDSQPPRCTRRLTAAALVLLTTVVWSRISSADMPVRIGGQINALVVDPHSPTTLYAASECFGVLESRDGGDSWQAVSTGLLTLVKMLAVDPSTTPITRYGAAAERTNGGVFKSTDGARTWSATGLIDTDVIALAVDPESPATLYAGTYFTGVFKSTDGASTWNAGLPDTAVTALVIDPENPATLYAGTWYGGEALTGGGVFKSTNGGDTCAAPDTSLLDRYDILALAIDPANPVTLYAGGYVVDGSSIFKSTDSAATWDALDTGLTGLHVKALVIDPANPASLYAAGYYRGGVTGAVFKSTDGGVTWAERVAGLPDIGFGALAIDPTQPTTLYAMTLLSKLAGLRWAEA